MAYNPTTWNTGDTITATAMNKIENGIANAGGGSAMVLSVDESTGALNKTAQEIYDAITSGTSVYVSMTQGEVGVDYTALVNFIPVVTLYTYDTTNVIRVCASGACPCTISGLIYPLTPAMYVFQASALSDYPTFYKTIIASASSAQSF